MERPARRESLPAARWAATGTNTGNEGARTGSWRLTHPVGEKPAKTDRLIAGIAGNQHGVLSSAQLRAAGLGDNAISKRAKAGRLHRLHRGVYAVGHTRLTFEGKCLAAALACGEDAVVSHRSAAALWGLLSPARGSIDVTVPGDGGREKRSGIGIHRSTALSAGHTTRRRGIPLTTPKRTLRDLHRTIPKPAYRRVVRRALDLHLIAAEDLQREEELTRSELERLFLGLCRRHRLPPPEVNGRVDRFEVDFLWREQRLIAETDGYRHHGHRAAFEADRARDLRLQSLGFRVLRFTYRQVTDAPGNVATSLRAVLGTA